MPSTSRDDSRTVLVVDDYPAMVTLTCEMLRLSGYTPLGYSDARKAVAEFAQHDVAAALTDQSMPDMDGLSVARALLAHQPDLPVILMSAVHDERLTPAYEEAGFCAVLSKPFTLQGLQACLKRALAPVA